MSQEPSPTSAASASAADERLKFKRPLTPEELTRPLTWLDKLILKIAPTYGARRIYSKQRDWEFEAVLTHFVGPPEVRKKMDPWNLDLITRTTGNCAGLWYKCPMPTDKSSNVTGLDDSGEIEDLDVNNTFPKKKTAETISHIT